VGSATRAAENNLAGLKPGGIDTGVQLMRIAAAIGANPSLTSALADPAIDDAGKEKLISTVFKGATADALKVASAAVKEEWSSNADLTAGIERLGIQAIAREADADKTVQELYTFQEVVSSDPELELALNSRLVEPAARADLAEKLLSKATPATKAIVAEMVRSPRNRRVHQLLESAGEIVAASVGKQVAKVLSASALDAAQVSKITETLSKQYGPVIAQVGVQPELIGGVKIQVGSDVLDGSLAYKINELKLQLS